jgi:hypothetical protein
MFGALMALAMLLIPSAVQAATLQVSTGRAVISAGDTIIAAILVSSPDQAANAISSVISFPTDLLSVVAVSKTNSILSLWIQDPVFSNQDGTVSFSGIVPDPGWTGLSGQVVSVEFRAKKPGTATIELTSSAVLANDGNGTNILTAATPRTLTISLAASAPPASVKPPAGSTPKKAPVPAEKTESATEVQETVPTPEPLGEPSVPWSLIALAIAITTFLSGVLGYTAGMRLRRWGLQKTAAARQLTKLGEDIRHDFFWFKPAKPPQKMSAEEKRSVDRLRATVEKAQSALDRVVMRRK